MKARIGEIEVETEDFAPTLPKVEELERQIWTECPHREWRRRWDEERDAVLSMEQQEQVRLRRHYVEYRRRLAEQRRAAEDIMRSWGASFPGHRMSACE